jgi:predicted alpha/beta hydrolase family esterase
MAASREYQSPIRRSADPLVLLVPGSDDPASAAWLAHWRALSSDCQPVDLGLWHDPHRNTAHLTIGVNKLNLAIHRAGRPVVLVAHGLGCLAVARWVEYETPGPSGPVLGALFDSPPDIDRPGSDPRLARFSACPRRPLPFSTWIIAAPQRPEAERTTLRNLAQDWGSGFIEAEQEPAGPSAHGVSRRLLGRLLRGAGGDIAPPASGSSVSTTLSG